MLDRALLAGGSARVLVYGCESDVTEQIGGRRVSAKLKLMPTGFVQLGVFSVARLLSHCCLHEDSEDKSLLIALVFWKS